VSSKTISHARTYAIVNGPGCPCFDKPKITRTRLTNEITYAIVNGPGCPCFDKPKITRTRLTNEIKPMVNNVF
ncbi:7640_t:CDS:2, partial [Entrophospora sp. SA101]